MRRRVRFLALTLAALASAVAAGFWAGGRVVSPQQAVARAAPPPAPEVSTRLTSRLLRHDIVIRGTLTRSAAYRVTAPLSLDGTTPAVVTAVHARPGRRLRDGDVVADVSGRPLIAATIRFPLYRDLVLGDQGPDVVQVVG